MADWKDELIKQIDDCEAHKSRLRPFEGQFLLNLRQRLNKDKPLTPNQEETLDYLLSKVTK
ncbi:hypothetical protein [Methylomicrobium sp. Wu6]|uniref:hypothetical protein n=1 Tax=Methylomicrobium sp. Wu6 TaxID=3107928 RepID=UPI002DD6B065|nr:hypothetical protein [Methylomicrobium sp. Wu6]MEC4750459.1 hypothetical protein [Methylomicrobium sp. Wu6]